MPKHETKQAIGVEQSDGCQLTARIATLGAVDSDGDVLLRGSFGRQTVPFIWAHNQKMIPLGKARVFEAGNDVVAEVDVLDEQACRWLKLDFASEPKQQYSWGFTVPEGAATTETLADGTEARVISAVDLMEVSGVLRGASVGTGTIGVKSECKCGGTCGCSGEPSNAAIIERAVKRMRGGSAGDALVREIALESRGEERVKAMPAPKWLKDISEGVCAYFDIEPRPTVEVFKRASIKESTSLSTGIDTLGFVEHGGGRPARILVRDGQSRHETIKTLLHEVGHVQVGFSPIDERTLDEWAEDQAARLGEAAA